MSEHHHTDYKKIYYWLVGLFLLSVIGPEITHNKALILVFAFGIAVVKAIMVAGWFMHLATEKRYVWYIFITSLSLLFLFIIATAPDIMKGSGHNWRSTIVVKAEDGHGAHHGDPHATETKPETHQSHDSHGDHGHAH